MLPNMAKNSEMAKIFRRILQKLKFLISVADKHSENYSIFQGPNFNEKTSENKIKAGDRLSTDVIDTKSSGRIEHACLSVGG